VLQKLVYYRRKRRPKRVLQMLINDWSKKWEANYLRLRNFRLSKRKEQQRMMKPSSLS
jgi:hypothetical protein